MGFFNRENLFPIHFTKIIMSIIPPIPLLRFVVMQNLVTCSSNDITLACTFSNVKCATCFAVTSSNWSSWAQKSPRSCREITKLTTSLSTGKGKQLACIQSTKKQLQYYLCKLNFNSKAFKTYVFNFLSLETLGQSKSCFNLYMLGLVQ